VAAVGLFLRDYTALYHIGLSPATMFLSHMTITNLCVWYKAVPLHAMQAVRGRGSIAPTHS
jgi:hypothetical protein